MSRRDFDDRLRDAARDLAPEPLPPKAFELHDDEASARGLGWIARGAAAALVLLVAVAVGLSAGQVRFPVGVEPSPSTSAEPSAEPSAKPSEDPSSSPAPTETPEPSPVAGDPVSAHLVGPGSECADGEIGYAVFLPDGWYANRRFGDGAPCTTIGHVREVDGRQILDQAVSVGRSESAEPGGSVGEVEDVTIGDGIAARRYVHTLPGSEAVMEEPRVSYVIPLLGPAEGGPGGFLLAWTDARHEAWVDGLDRIMERFRLQPSLAASGPATTRAHLAYEERDTCIDEERGLAVVFPDAWWTNTAVEGLPACSWFAPSFFEIDDPTAVADEVEITISLVEGGYGKFDEIVATDSTMAADRLPATRWELDHEDGRTYEIVVLLGDVEEFGPNLVIRTTVTDPDRLDDVKALVDKLAEHITLAVPPPGASSDEPPIEGRPPVSSSDTDADFVLTLRVEQDRYRAGQPIIAGATLTYVGPAESVVIGGSGHSIIGFAARQIDGEIDVGPAFTSDCSGYELVRDEPLVMAYGKSGGFSPGEPGADWLEAYFLDPLLRLPAGTWSLGAGSSFYAGDDCGAGTLVSLTTSVEVVVEP